MYPYKIKLLGTILSAISNQTAADRNAFKYYRISIDLI